VPVPLPDAEGKVLYVWFDAPIGYVSITRQLFEERGDPGAWERWWKDAETTLVHFIGKDNITFHVVVFPAMLHGVKEGYVLPAAVPANEFFNLEGRKFNKSAGWYIGLEEFFARYDADAARYALIAALPETADSDFLWREFQQRVNVDLADTIGNFVSRTLRFVERYFGGKVPAARAWAPDEEALLAATGEAARRIEEAILGFSFRKAAAALIELGWNANRYYDQAKPWETRTKEPERCARSIRACAEVVRSLAVLSAPFMPGASQRTWEMLGLAGKASEVPWEKAAAPGLPDGELAIGQVSSLFRKIPDEEIEEEIEKLRRMSAEPATPPEERSDVMSEAAPVPVKPPVSYEDFAKLDLRIGVVKAAERHPNAERLLRIDVEIGGETRQVIAGIAGSYEPASLVGRRVVVLANLEPKQLRGLASNGMLLAADVGGKPLLLSPEGSPPPGTPVK
jgi:methionyl-tRNA synthetase